ncbi:MAG: hypothetical protein R2824_31190 [Saprospiraceae bacterium]
MTIKKYNRIKSVEELYALAQMVIRKLGKDPVTISPELQHPTAGLGDSFEIADLLRVPVCVLLEESRSGVDRKKNKRNGR